MQLWLVRHAIAEDLSDVVRSDADRQLTDKGRRKFRKLAEHLAEAGLRPDVILSSPLIRAVQTAEILRESLAMSKQSVLVDRLLAPGFDLNRLLNAIARRPITALVGHEPDLSQSLSLLVGGGQFDFGKGNVACVEFPGDAAIGAGWLKWFLRPSVA